MTKDWTIVPCYITGDRKVHCVLSHVLLIVLFSVLERWWPTNLKHKKLIAESVWMCRLRICASAEIKNCIKHLWKKKLAKIFCFCWCKVTDIFWLFVLYISNNIYKNHVVIPVVVKYIYLQLNIWFTPSNVVYNFIIFKMNKSRSYCLLFPNYEMC